MTADLDLKAKWEAVEASQKEAKQLRIMFWLGFGVASVACLFLAAAVVICALVLRGIA